MAVNASYPSLPGYSLRRLVQPGENYRQEQINLEYVNGPGALGTLTLVEIPRGTSGVVEKWKLISDSPLMQEGWLEISYDGGVTWPFSCELGVLFGARPSSAVALTSTQPYKVACEHMFTQQFNDRALAMSLSVMGGMRYPIPFTDGLIIRLKNPKNVDYSNGGFYSETSVTYCPKNEVWPYQLRSTSANMNSSGITSNNFTFNSNGFVLNSANVAMNGADSGNPIVMTASQRGQLAKLTGRGWVVGMAYVSLTGTPGTLNNLERNIAWYVDGATPPDPGGEIISPARGQIYGPGVGSPTMHSTGTEDTFDTPYYGWADRANGAFLPAYSAPTAMGTGNGSSERGYHFNAFVDILASARGYRFDSSLECWLLTESRVTVSHTVGWSILYYADLS